MTTSTAGPSPAEGREIKRFAVGVLILVAVAALVVEFKFGWLSASYRFLAAEETAVNLTVNGMVCGTQPEMQNYGLNLKPGSRVTFYNHTGYWTVPLSIGPNETPFVPMVESPPIPPGSSWTYVFWRPGRYTAQVPMEARAFLAGLSQDIRVGR